MKKWRRNASVAISLALVLRSSTDIGKSLQYVVNDVWKGKKKSLLHARKAFCVGGNLSQTFPETTGQRKLWDQKPWTLNAWEKISFFSISISF